MSTGFPRVRTGDRPPFMEDRLTSERSLRGTLWTGRERDACGMGFVARRDGVAGHAVVELALRALERLAHRGAVDADDAGGEPTGDGAGVLLQVPWRLLLRHAPEATEAAAAGRCAVAMCFLPRDRAEQAQQAFESIAGGIGARVLAWRDVEVDETALGAAARATRPTVRQALVELPAALDPASREPFAYRLRRLVARGRADGAPYVASLSTRTVTYKGLVVGHQLRRAFPDLADPRCESALAVFHQRYSTNTFPTWERAQPCHSIAHNGEINTLQGNVTWMRARGLDLGWRDGTAGPDDDGSWLQPVLDADGSDSAMLDDAVQLLLHGGRILPEAITMLVPPAWDHEQDVHEPVRDLLRLHAAATEPWDGPAAIAYTDGALVGAALDRNGLRPARWLETRDGLVACASEVGAVPIDPADVLRSGRLGPGQSIVLDVTDGSLHCGDEQLLELAEREPWGVVVAAQQVEVPDATAAGGEPAPGGLPVVAAQALHGYTREELTAVLRPMVANGLPPVGSMGDDTPIAPLATWPRAFFGHVRQRFAEVTNPAIDPLRERSTMSLDTIIGPRPRLLDRRGASRPGMRLRSPLLTDAGLRSLRAVAESNGVRVELLDTCLETAEPTADDLRQAVASLCEAAVAASDADVDVLVLSDRAGDPDRPPLPSLLAVSAVHQHLVDLGRRTRVGLIVEAGDVREPHHVAALIGHGVAGVVPWLALATATDLATGPRSRLEVDAATAQQRLVAALEAGLRTAMSRMGISTVDGYRGAQVFEAVGLDDELAHHLRGTLLRPGSVGFDQLAADVARRAAHAREHARADAAGATPLPSPGFHKFKRGGELHGFEPAVVTALHEAVGVDDPLGEGLDEARAGYRRYASLVRDRPAIDVRDLLQLRPAGPALPLEEVEPALEIVRRCSTGAMSHGSLGAEAHETLAAGVALVGASSNSGEGGEAVERFGTERSSRIKQVASGRFGVTPAYLRSAQELQVKIAQGSKPGEGGHLPGDKVTEEIARIRHTRLGVSLISPPPHHDIYSIEDLAQLLHDLASIHPRAARSVKLVSQAGIGTIAAGVAKARAEVIVVSGASGGTGASPLGSIKYAGMPWEWGLAETQQVLVANRLRGRVRLRADGGLRTGRDVLVAAMLGADEFSFGTAVLIAEGCRMARTCHNDQCPVGIATQRADLRALFPGRPESVAAFLLLVAEEVRELLAALGMRRLDEAIGRVDLLRQRSSTADAAGAPEGGVDLTAMLQSPDVPAQWPRRFVGERNDVPGIEEGLDHQLADALWPSVLAWSDGDAPVRWTGDVGNVDRSLGARLSGDIAEHLAADGLSDTAVHATFRGIAGQSFGAFAIRGLRLELEGEANDYVGKGLAGAHLDVRFPDSSTRAGAAADNVLVGNACLYGATSGLLLACGTAGERFAVRNSGADAVVEGAGDHLCEYMTGGTVVVLGPVGRNVASGMSGGLLWVLDDRARIDARMAPTAAVVEPSRAELDELHRLLTLHAERTGSERARSLLEEWTAHGPRGLTCIAPTERVLAATAARSGASGG